MIKSNKGITIVALIITVVVMLILITVTIEIGTEEIEKAKLEDLKTTMLLIKGRAQIVADKEEFGETYDNTGMVKLSETTTYNTTNLQTIFEGLEDASNLYIWEQTAMDNNSIFVTITTTDFYVIDYSTGEVYYSLGYLDGDTTYYSLTDIQKIGEE